jgi:DNA-binding CsgD family transcriptional regulator
MNESVRVVHPLHDAALIHAQSTWNAGEYSACLAELERLAPSAQRFLIAAWTSYRLRRYDDALASLAQGHAFFQHPREQCEADALSCVLHEIKGNHRESDVFFERAASVAPKAQSGKASNMLALRAWLRDDYEQCLRRLRPGESDTDANVRAYARSLRSWVHASRRQFASQAQLLKEVLDIALSALEPDVGLVADTLQAISHRCRELDLPEEFIAACAVVRDLRWTPDLQMQRYNTLRHIGWTYALGGQYVLGLRQLAAARDAAPKRALTAVSTLDAAWVTWASGERNAAQAHLQEALEIIGDVDWQAHRGSEEIWALLLASELCITIQGDAAQAERLMDAYERAKGSISVRVAVAHNRSFDPIEDAACALIHAARGNVGPARKLAKRAYGEFAAMGYQWRAARCALFLYESGCGDTWLAAAREQAANYPRSFIGAQLERIRMESSSETLARLTPRQRDVVRLLVQGDTVDDVAAALNTSPNTVRVHLKHIHRALGVRNRVELLRAVKQSA